MSTSPYIKAITTGKYASGLGTFPHCDWRILHSPAADCEYCNMHPVWQKARLNERILFTDDPFNEQLIELFLSTGKFGTEKWRPCPAMQARGRESVDAWHGNVVMNADARRAREDYFKKLRELFGGEDV